MMRSTSCDNLADAVPPPTVGKPSDLILVVEDEATIGLDLCDNLEEIGYLPAGPFTRCCDALAWLRSFTPVSAIVDYTLRDGLCLELVRELRRRCVPFVIFSGHLRKSDFTVEFAGAPWIDKPATLASLLAALGEAH